MSTVKILSLIFYKTETNWLKVEGQKKWDKIRLIVFMNHTSLFEPLYLSQVPFPFLFRLSRKMVAPGADKTLSRPIVGLFWRFLSPGMKSITRKRDDSWKEFMSSIEERSVIIIAPEGRMKRPTGLDLNGNKMSIRGGIADILENIDEGNMIIVYSGGLHHVQTPGQKIPNLFKRIKINIEQLDIPNYKNQFGVEGRAWKKSVVDDLQHRLENNPPIIN
jgi:hypothetical protein